MGRDRASTTIHTRPESRRTTRTRELRWWPSQRGGEANQPGGGGLEAGRSIEWREFRCEVDVKPLTASCPRYRNSVMHETETDAAALMARVHGRIEQEGMLASIGGDIHETDEAIVDPCGDRSEAPRQDRCK